MATRRNTGKNPQPSSTAGPADEEPEMPMQDPSSDLAAAQVGIAELQAQLAAQNTPDSETISPNRLADVLETLAQRLAAAPAASAKPAKIPDPDNLTNGEDPTFDSWKLQ